MKKFILTLAFFSLGITFLISKANASNIKEGQWTMTTVMHMEGMDEEADKAMKEMEKMSPEEKAMMERMMGGMKIGGQDGGMSITMSQCLTNDNPVPEAKEQKDCEQTHTMKGNTVNFEITCPDSHSIGQVTYKNDSMKGTIQSTKVEKGKEINATIDISGQYEGPCDETAKNNMGLSEEEFAMKKRALDLKKQELDLKKEELELESASKGKSPSPKSAGAKIEDVNKAVNTTNNVKNTFNGLRSLLGR